MSQGLTEGNVEIIEWMLNLTKQTSTSGRMAFRLRKAVAKGILIDADEYYELSERWLNRYIFTNSQYSKVSRMLKVMGGKLDRPTNPKKGKGWEFSNVPRAKEAEAYLARDVGVKANRYGTLITSVVPH